MLEVTTAKAWGMPPSEFSKCSDEDKAYMIALEETNAKISSANAFVAEEKAKKDERKRNRPSSRRGRNV